MAWPPVYDQADIDSVIGKFISESYEFYENYPRHGLEYCQGDIIRLSSGAPYIAENGSPMVFGDFQHWVLVSNTCDIDRTIDHTPFLQLVPVYEIPISDFTAAQSSELRNYKMYKQFYLPQGNNSVGSSDSVIWLADFTQWVTLHKAALIEHCTRSATLSMEGWFLFYSCVIRFLCREDERYSPTA